MDTNALVTSGRLLLELLDRKGVRCRAGLWMHNTDVDTWKFWIVPPKDLDDKREFYRKVAETIQENSSNFPTLDASDTEMVNENHSVIKDLKRLVKIPDLGHFDLTNSRIGNLYVAHLIALRMDF